MKRFVVVATVIAALAVTLVVGVAAAQGPNSGHGQQISQTSVMPGTGDMLKTQARLQLHVDTANTTGPQATGDMLQTKDRLQLHVDTANTPGPQAAGGMFAGLPDGATVDSVTRDVQVDGTVKTVTATFTVTLADGSQTEITRVHVYEQQSDGSWVLTSAPDCPYR